MDRREAQRKSRKTGTGSDEVREKKGEMQRHRDGKSNKRGSSRHILNMELLKGFLGFVYAKIKLNVSVLPTPKKAHLQKNIRYEVHNHFH